MCMSCAPASARARMRQSRWCRRRRPAAAAEAACLTRTPPARSWRWSGRCPGRWRRLRRRSLRRGARACARPAAPRSAAAPCGPGPAAQGVSLGYINSTWLLSTLRVVPFMPHACRGRAHRRFKGSYTLRAVPSTPHACRGRAPRRFKGHQQTMKTRSPGGGMPAV